MAIFVGREPELKKIRELLQKDRGVLMFSGESGMGKTALLEKAATEYKGQPGVLIALRSCLRGDHGASPFMALLADLLRQLGEQQVRPVGEHLKELGKALLDNAPEMGKALLISLLEMLGAKAAKPFAPLFREVEKQAHHYSIQIAIDLLSKNSPIFIEQYLLFLNTLTKDFPTYRFVLILDQMEYPDLSAQYILLDLAGKLPSRSFLLIGFKREIETQAKYNAIKNQLNVIADEKELPGLSVEDIDDWVKQATGKDLLQPQLRAIRQASGGLPYLLYAWIERWKEKGGEPDIAELKEGKALDRYFHDRLGSLSPEAQEFVYRLSILLDPLMLDEYCRLVEKTGGQADPTRCQRLMKELEDKLIFGDKWWFRHEKIQSFIERQLHPEVRLKYHKEAAALFEENIISKEGATFSEVRSLSFHYHKAEEWQKSLEYNGVLANAAFRLRSLDIAEECYQRAEEAARKLGDEESAIVNRGNLASVYNIWGWVGETEQIYKNTLQYYQVKGNKTGQATALQQLGRIEDLKGNLDKAEGLYQDSLTIAREIGDKGGISNSFQQLGRIEHLKGNLDKAEGLYQESLKLKREIGDKGGISNSLHELGIIEQHRGNLEKAEGLCQESLKLKREIGDKGGIAKSLHQLGNIEYIRGDPEKAEGLYLISWKLFREIGDKGGISNSLHELGIIEQHRGNLEKAEGLYQESLKLKREIGDKDGIANSLGQLGLLYTQRDDFEQALSCLAFAYTLFAEMGVPRKKQALAAMARIWEKIGEEKFKEMVERVQERTGEEKPPVT